MENHFDKKNGSGEENRRYSSAPAGRNERVPRVIAGVYEIDRKIGSGGGGIVYLGRHLRLEKPVVLKADKRTLAAKPEALRREVDMLKGLSHTYIPQVYDFVEQNGVVYTVMDYIEGESLDKLLARGELPSQPEVIRWAGQLLKALIYLHGQPPHGILHGDIKPANIMLRPNGDICLIDYNIALALGEDGAVQVGGSRGYASPEHYGSEFADGQMAGLAATESIPETELVEETVQMEPAEDTVWMDPDSMPDDTELMVRTSGTVSNASSGSQSTGGRKLVKLDVRSDIYSLGATLYHLLSGRRPAPSAAEVEPLSADECSPAVARIIEKAMAPDPAMRYQSAEEMFSAFCQLYRQDRRSIRRRRRELAAACTLTLLFLAGGAGAFTGLKQMEQRQNALALAEYSANQLEEGNISGAVRTALKAIPKTRSIFQAPVTAQARKALTDALGVYDLSDGFQALDTIELPSAPFSLEFSPSGSRFAAVYAGEVSVFDSESRTKLAALPIGTSAFSDCLFISDSRILYAGADGVSVYDLDEKRTVWTGAAATKLALSGDGAVAAAADLRGDQAVFYRVSDGEKLGERSFNGKELSAPVNDIFADPGNSVFALNDDGSLLAVSFSDGGLMIFDADSPDDDLIMYDQSSYTRFDGGFCGRYFAFAANKSDQSLFGLIDTVDAVYAGGLESRDNFYLEADKRGIFLSNGNLLVSFSPDTLEETELAFTEGVTITGFSVGEDYVMVSADDNSFRFFNSAAGQMSSVVCEEPCDFVKISGDFALAGNRSQPSVRLLRRKNREGVQLMSYDARYAHDEARISQDGKTAMLFDYESFRIYDMDGNEKADVQLPDPESIYDQQFQKTEDGSWLEVIWYDGTVRCYSAEDGSVMSEEKKDPPQKDLYEEFFTDRYRITSPLHGAPEVYDLETGKKLAVLETEDYLTYVTDTEEGLLTEYVTAEGKRYGLLLDENFEAVASLPELCDIQGKTAVFDDKSGNLRQCRLYSLQELIALGEAYTQSSEKEE